MIMQRDTIVDTEAALVGALVVWPQEIDRVPATLTGGDFLNRDLGACFEAVMQRHRAGEPVDGPLVALALTSEQADLLQEAMAAAGTAHNVEHHARAILAAGVVRQITTTAATLGRTSESPVDPHVLLARLASLSETAEARLAGAMPTDGVEAGDGLAAVLARAEAARDGSLAGIPTGLGRFDYYSGGLQRGCTIVIGARTSFGKSALAGQFAVHAAATGSHVAVFSFEMSAADFYRRFAAAASGINGVRIREGRLEGDEWRILTTTCSELAYGLGSRLRIFDRISRDIPVLLLTARRLHRQGKLDLLVIDFLQKLQIGREISRSANRNAELEKISGAIADLARELQIPVIVGSQLNRAAEGVRPSVANLRDSGTIEQDADLVVAIHGDRESDERELIILKNRDGNCGSIRTRFDRDRLVFVEESQ